MVKLNTSKKIKQIVFLDAKVENYQSLLTATRSNVAAYVIASDRDGVEQIIEILRSGDEINDIHIVSHGSPGCLYLGNTQLSLDTLNNYIDLLRLYFSGQSRENIPNLYLYGCNVAAGDGGEEFLTKLSQITGGSIFASARRTGNADLGGDWLLEVRVSQGKIREPHTESRLPFQRESLLSYPSVLSVQGNYNSITQVDKYIYAVYSTGTETGLEIYGPKASDPDALEVKGSYKDLDPNSTYTKVTVVGNSAYVLSTSRLLVIDITDKTKPTPIATQPKQDIGIDISDMAINANGDVAYGTPNDGSQQLEIIDLTSNNKSAAFLKIGGAPQGITVDGNYLYVAEVNDTSSKVEIFQIDSVNHSKLTLDQTKTISLGTDQYASNVAISGGYVFVVYNTPTTINNVDALQSSVNIYSLDTLQLKGTYTLDLANADKFFDPAKSVEQLYSNFRGDITVDGNYAYFAYSLIGQHLDPNIDDYVTTVAESGLKRINLTSYTGDNVPIKTTDNLDFVVNDVARIGGYTYFADSNGFHTPPTDVNLSGTKVAPDNDNAEIGTLTTTDLEDTLATSFKYELLTNTTNFKIDGDKLYTAQKLNKGTQAIQIKSTDPEGLFHIEDFTISVGLDNSAPTGISLSKTQVNYDPKTGNVVGTLKTTDPDDLTGFTYTLLSNTDNFEIVGDELRSKTLFAVKDDPQTVDIKSTDKNGTGLFKIEKFNIDINFTPTDITLSQNTFNAPLKGPVANLSTSDPDGDKVFKYTLLSNTDNFKIDGNQLLTTKPLDTFVDQTVKIQSTDEGGLSYTKDLTIYLNAAPNNIKLDKSKFNAPLNGSVGYLSTTDPDGDKVFKYTLLSNTDNFKILGNELLTTKSLNGYQNQTVKIQSTDEGGLSYSQDLIININVAPTDITLTGNKVSLTSSIGTPVGDLSTSDDDTKEAEGDSFTYTLLSNTKYFKIEGNQLKTNDLFSNTQPQTVDIQTTDSNKLSYNKSFTINIINTTNHAPTNINLSGTQVNTYQPSNTLIGNLSTTDPDGDTNFTYQLLDGNSEFFIQGNQLFTSKQFTSGGTRTISIQTTDAGKLSYNKYFSITINKINRAPTDLTLSGNQVNTYQPSNTLIGNLSTTDPDGDTNFTYQLLDGNNDFFIQGNELFTNKEFTTADQKTVAIKTTDGGGLSYNKFFSININKINRAPSDISLSGNQVKTYQPSKTLIGNLSTTDPDGDSNFTYQLLDGNSDFVIEGNQLFTNKEFTTASPKTINIKTTDAGGLSYSKSFTIAINSNNSNNHAPTKINLSANTVKLNQPIGTLVGNLSTVDPDGDTSFTYQLLSNNNNFLIQGNQLKTNSIFTKTGPQTVSIKTTDAGGLSYQQDLTITTASITQLQSPVMRYRDSLTGMHFYTANLMEQSFIAQSLPSFQLEGPAFIASLNPQNNLLPIYRFFNPTTGDHFFTANQAERDSVINNIKVYQYEGIGFYSYGADAKEGTNVLRFFNPTSGEHFYTMSQAEQAAVQTFGFMYEGVAFKAL
ncbi:DUF4347 domain-containing protein [Gloeothece verrucosa]|uniref:Cadherin n=1 Tax=Gloeothece verrucosa (strain PCC 7822) TaxID=497965 RepID=E0UBB2_GLOV7|nr:DUF4347 domain-containing protein [Gloeothece verrucosa]ADN17468.1 Cadherin [Gloeothece verrucosa PCC 7822]